MKERAAGEHTVVARGCEKVLRQFSEGYKQRCMRVLVALNPKMYCQTIVFFLAEHRPHLQLKAAEPADLEQELSSFRPDLLICHETIPTVRQRVLSQVEILYSDGLDALVRVEDRESRLNNISVQNLLCVVDETEKLASSGS